MKGSIFERELKGSYCFAWKLAAYSGGSEKDITLQDIEARLTESGLLSL